MLGRAVAIVALGLSGVAADAVTAAAGPPKRGSNMSHAQATYVPITFRQIPGWAADDHAAAYAAFVRSCPKIVQSAATKSIPSPLAAVCGLALTGGRAGSGVSGTDARRFFETNFVPHRVEHPARHGLVTGYYEPLVPGSRQRSAAFPVPIYRRPADLVNVVVESERGAKAEGFTHLRQRADGTREPYPSRQDIEAGALAGQGLELFYLADPVDAFFMQVQGSGRIALREGGTVRVTYDGKNGHPYTSVGRYLIETGAFVADQVSLESLANWLRADPERGRRAMWQNKSFVFFRALPADATGPLGVMNVALTDGRSLAVDTGYHALGLPVWVTAPALAHATPGGGFARLMIAQDVGSAIRGPERGDIYFGSGDAAGRLAGVTKHAANFIVLLPQDPARSGVAGEVLR